MLSMGKDRLTRPPHFDPEKATGCVISFCGIGNSAVAAKNRMCTYMEQTNPLDDGCVSPADLATGPGWAGWMRNGCPFGEEVFRFRTSSPNPADDTPSPHTS